MKHTGYTPGPWQAEPIPGKAGWNIKDSDGNPSIARVYQPRDLPLILDAPRLAARVERLTEALVIAQRLLIQGNHSLDYIGATEALDAIRDALAGEE